jgi:pimeloyl-ACP methyl ester carboxylesterase
MWATMLLLGALPVADSSIETQFVEVAPARQGLDWLRSSGQRRAVVLIHGLYVHPFSKASVTHPHLHNWQTPDCLLVKRLAQEADVYAFSYAQTLSSDEIADCPDLARHIYHLQRYGYEEIILVGHSAGGVIARQFVEDTPTSGVTKVIQVCAPNTGSSWAMCQTVRSNQVQFLESLTKKARRRSLTARADVQVPSQMQFACVVGTGAVVGDGLVSIRSQYSPDLRRQGIPVYPVNSTHWMLLRCQKGVDLVARLVREPQPRWDTQHVAAVCHQMLWD